MRQGAGRALVVEDEELVRGSVADMLTELDYEVGEASSAEEALELLATVRRCDHRSSHARNEWRSARL